MKRTKIGLLAALFASFTSLACVSHYSDESTRSGYYGGYGADSYKLPENPTYRHPSVAENGSFYGQLNKQDRPKTVPVRGYYRRDGTYVRGHYRAPPRRR